MPSFRFALSTLLVTFLVGCATAPRVHVPEPLRPVTPATTESANLSPDAGGRDALRQVATPTPPQVATAPATSAMWPSCNAPMVGTRPTRRPATR